MEQAEAAGRTTGTFEAESFLMDTAVTQKVCGAQAEAAYRKAVAELGRLEGLLSFFLPTSDIARINANAGKARVEVHRETRAVLECAQRFSGLSESAFDVTLAPLIDLWRRRGGEGRVPAQDEIEQALSCVGMRFLELRGDTAYLSREGCAIDLGGIAKGYAADRCIELYRANGVGSAFVNLGGNVKVLGEAEGGRRWAIGLQHPDEPRGTCFGLLLMSGRSVVTSGGYERYVVVDGRRYHHILDPRTGRPVESGLKAATVVCEDSMAADALSTAAYVRGLDEGLALVAAQTDTDAVFVTEKNEVLVTRGLKDCFQALRQTGLTCSFV
ncbi:MAG: FAD:protein FMN transferase [Coriobacteriales bacterium]|nr:FAD:protein FMN transferase [Coriobacteriales bacterium]